MRRRHATDEGCERCDWHGIVVWPIRTVPGRKGMIWEEED